MVAGLTLTVEIHPDISAIAEDDWDRCAGDLNPFTRHAFLRALEQSGSATATTGWQPQHLLLKGSDGQIRGIVPLYSKSHSMGEYVFDQGWAHAYEEAGGRYYPKLQSSIPFTPVTGPRLMADPKGGPPPLVEMAEAIKTLAQNRQITNAHATFISQRDANAFAGRGFLLRHGLQYHWINRGYATFDEFLDALTSRKRKMIKRERREALSEDIEIEHFTGSDLRETHWDHFYAFYLETGNRKWGAPYLTRNFFSLIGESMADRILLILAKRGGKFIAGALNFIGPETIFGRYWGAIEHHRFLHFELAYYQAIEYAINNNLKSVEAGAQGEHKVARGYEPVPTLSAHHIAEPSLKSAIERFLKEEKNLIRHEREFLCDLSPYKTEKSED